MRRKKIMFVIPSMTNGGAERVVATLSNSLIDEYDIKIMAITGEKSFYKLNDKVTFSANQIKLNKNKRIVRNLQQIFGLPKVILNYRNEIKDYQPDVVISFIYQTNQIMLLLKILNSKMRLIVSERNDPLARSRVNQTVTKLLYKKADLIVCQSEYVDNFFQGSIERNRIIPNPVNIETVPAEVSNEKRDVIIGVGRLFPQKNFDLLIRSFKKIASDFPTYSLEIYGEGPDRPFLEKTIEELNLSDRVSLKGVKENVFQYAYYSRLFVMSSNYEGFPNALLEAMCAGLPVISTDFPTGVARNLIGEKNGILVPVNNPKEMSIAIEKIINNPNLQKKMSAENLKYREKYSTSRIATEWKTAIEELINRNENENR